MARALTPNDAHVLINSIAKEATGQEPAIKATDTSSFVSVGETILNTGTENTLNSLSIVLGRTFAAVRPYEAKLKIISALNSGAYTNRVRKISYYSREALPAGDWNTQLFTENLKDGAENTGTDHATKSQWEQNQPIPLEVNFGGSSVWQDSTTVYEYQLKEAFRDETSFNAFVTGIMTEKANDMETQKESFNRMTLLNYIGGIYDMSASMPKSVINLTEAYNAKFGTSYTSEQLRTTYLKSFLEFFVATFKTTSKQLTNRTANYHAAPEVPGHALLRHTPMGKQKAILYEPLFIDAEAQVLPEIFNENMLKMENYEPVLYWQNFNEPTKISITPAIPDFSTGLQKAGSAVALDYVVGILYDTDALMTDYQLESAYSTPIEARKRYRNVWWSYKRNAINDFTENAVLFIMKDPDPGKAVKK